MPYSVEQMLAFATLRAWHLARWREFLPSSSGGQVYFTSLIIILWLPHNSPLQKEPQDVYEYQYRAEIFQPVFSHHRLYFILYLEADILVYLESDVLQ